MRHVQAMVLAVAFATAGCCFLPPSEQLPVHNESQRPVDINSSSTGVVFLDVAQIERPVGDTFVNHDLWMIGNEQGIDFETQPVLEENGLRVCQIGGLIPAQLQALLSSPRTCPDPRRVQAEFDMPTQLTVGSVRDKLHVEVHQRGGSKVLDLEQANCLFEITASLEEDQRIRLSFVPKIRHGQTQLVRHVAQDPGGQLRWAMEAREPLESFPSLRWELLISPEEYVVIGARLDHPSTLGPGYLVSGKGEGAIQKLLVLRASLLAPEKAGLQAKNQAPLAHQASMTVRGNGK